MKSAKKNTFTAAGSLRAGARRVVAGLTPQLRQIWVTPILLVPVDSIAPPLAVDRCIEPLWSSASHGLTQTIAEADPHRCLVLVVKAGPAKALTQMIELRPRTVAQYVCQRLDVRDELAREPHLMLVQVVGQAFGPAVDPVGQFLAAVVAAAEPARRQTPGTAPRFDRGSGNRRPPRESPMPTSDRRSIGHPASAQIRTRHASSRSDEARPCRSPAAVDAVSTSQARRTLCPLRDTRASHLRQL